MTIQKLKALTEHLPADTIVLIDLPDRTSDVETINIQYHTDGRAHLILSNKEWKKVLTMLKTNSKKARENIQQYIINHFTPEGYTDETIEGFENVAAFILKTFRSEKYGTKEDFRYYHNNEAAAFEDWCAGLPSVLDTCYYYNRSAVDDLGTVLEETETEKSRYSEEAAENTLTALIYRELTRGLK